MYGPQRPLCESRLISKTPVCAENAVEKCNTLREKLCVTSSGSGLKCLCPYATLRAAFQKVHENQPIPAMKKEIPWTFFGSGTMKTFTIRIAAVLVFILLFSTIGLSSTGNTGKEVSEADKTHIEQSFGKLPLYFIENQGQVHKDVTYYVKGSDKTLYFTSKGVTFALTGKEGDEEKRWTVKLEFVGVNPNCKPRGEEKQEAVFSYFKGKPKDWKTGCPTYKKLLYRNLWPGIDLVYKGTVNKLKYKLVVKPGADPGQIRLVYRGAAEVKIQETGELKVITPAGDLEDARPYAYQMHDGKQMDVYVAYALDKEMHGDVFTYRFHVGSYDPKKSLILDPVMLLYCGFIGGAKYEVGLGIAVDTLGNAYVTGWTESSETGFPTTKVGPDLSFNGGSFDAFVAKVNGSGTDLVYCGYIGGVETDCGYNIAVDTWGNAYVTGGTESTEESFPVKAGPDLSFNGGQYGGDTFVAKINADGTDLDYCGYIGGRGDDWGYDIAVDPWGNAYVTGNSSSTETSFPVKVGPDLTYNGSPSGEDFGDGFVAKINAEGTELIYCGYIGGIEDDWGHGIAIDIWGNAYVSGTTLSSEASFPVKIGPDLTFNGFGIWGGGRICYKSQCLRHRLNILWIHRGRGFRSGS